MSTLEMTREYDDTEIPAPGVYAIDPAHSSVEFIARHLMFSKVRGRFAVPSGAFTIADDPRASHVDVTLDAASVSTGDDGRDTHLRSADFFDVDNFPTIRFVSSGVRHVSGDRWAVDGELTIKGVTKPVSLDLEVGGVTRDPWGNVKLGLSASSEIDREEWGVSFNMVLEGGGVVVGKKVKIELEIEAALQS